MTELLFVIVNLCSFNTQYPDVCRKEYITCIEKKSNGNYGQYNKALWDCIKEK